MFLNLPEICRVVRHIWGEVRPAVIINLDARDQINEDTGGDVELFALVDDVERMMYEEQSLKNSSISKEVLLFYLPLG